MIPDPLEAFRRATAATLARMEQAFVERALTLPGLLAGEVVNGARRAVTNTAQLALDAVQMLVRLPHHLADMLADSWRGPDARALTVRERLAIADAYGYRARPDLLRIVTDPAYRRFRARHSKTVIPRSRSAIQSISGQRPIGRRRIL